MKKQSNSLVFYFSQTVALVPGLQGEGIGRSPENKIRVNQSV